MTDSFPIEFHRAAVPPPDAPEPVPLSQALPEWLRLMPAAMAQTTAADETDLTLRACAPLMDAMTLGYALRWPMTVRIIVAGREGNGDFDLRVEPAAPAILSSHPPRQAPGMPGAGMPILKLTHPWIIRTPPGTACLIAPLFNQPERILIPFAALVDTDRYFNALHVPFMLALPVGGEITVARGEPFAQLIPFTRQDWRAVAGEGDPAALSGTRAILDRNRPGAYAKHIRSRRRFD